MEDLLANQHQIAGGINSLLLNFKKDGPERKTAEYIKRRMETLDGYWQEFQSNHVQLIKFPDQSHQYFVSNHYQQTYDLYLSVREKLQATTSGSRPTTPQANKNFDFPVGESSTKSQGVNSKLDDLIKKQMSNFKAFTRTVQNININIITEKWEFEDSLKNLESRWAVIDAVHWELDSILDGSNQKYERTFSEHEQTYNNTKTILNSNLRSMVHREKTTPHMDVPIFHVPVV